MKDFVKVELADASHGYQYVNTSFIYAIMEDGGRCKLVMAGHDDVLVLKESVADFLARI